jgi:hypothetical protein
MSEFPSLDYFTSKEGIEKYSNPKIVQKKAKEYGVYVVYSPRKNKKYRTVNPITNKFVDFGQMGFIDFTLSKDEEKRRLFRLRNHKWKDADKYSSASLSYNILW